MARFQQGSLRVEPRTDGPVWVLRFYITREADGKRVQHKTVVGSVRELPTKSAALAEVDQQHLRRQINQPRYRGRITFAHLVDSYMRRELDEQNDTLATSTKVCYRGQLQRLLQRWGKRLAVAIEPLEFEDWLATLPLSNRSRVKLRWLTSAVYRHGQRYGIVPRTADANPMHFVKQRTTSDYQPVVLTPQQAFAIVLQMGEPERTLTLLIAATGLRIGESLGLQWGDVDIANQQIHVRRAWEVGQIGPPKSKASKASVPLHPVLQGFLEAWRKETPYGMAGGYSPVFG
jgi:integrase